MSVIYKELDNVMFICECCYKPQPTKGKKRWRNNCAICWEHPTYACPTKANIDYNDRKVVWDSQDKSIDKYEEYTKEVSKAEATYKEETVQELADHKLHLKQLEKDFEISTKIQRAKRDKHIRSSLSTFREMQNNEIDKYYKHLRDIGIRKAKTRSKRSTTNE